MINLLYGSFARPLLLSLEPELAHKTTLLALKSLPLPAPPVSSASLKVTAFGLNFPNPLGMAAGFDKNAEVVDPLLRIGFGFVEVGTITPLPQVGNPHPRVFRYPKDGAIINRLGFNSQGHEKVHTRLKFRLKSNGVLGVNIGANKDTLDRASDYVTGIKTFSDVADYFTLNISSPNTPGLRDLQHMAALDDLLARALEARDQISETKGHKPILLKIAPDLSLSELDDVIQIARARRIDGMVVSNTTLTRPSALRTEDVQETGGLSGRPLFDLSTRMLAATFLRVERQFPLIGVGGIDSFKTALIKIEAGADLLQLYSGLVFHGPHLIVDILQGLAQHLRPNLLLKDIVGTRASELNV